VTGKLKSIEKQKSNSEKSTKKSATPMWIPHLEENMTLKIQMKPKQSRQPQ
jgi:hypothetical protein